MSASQLEPPAARSATVREAARRGASARLSLMMVSGERLIPGGGRGPFWEMQRMFSKHFERIDVICPKPTSGPFTVPTIHDNVHFHPADCGRFGMVRHIREKGAELIARHGHALITSHDYGIFYNGIGSARLSAETGVPYLSEIHHVPGYPVSIGTRERVESWSAKRYLRWARRRAAAFRVVNESELAPLLVRLGVPPAKVLVLRSLYIDLETFQPAPEPLPLEHDVVYAGRFVSNKGLERVIDAAALMKVAGRPIRVLLVGMGPLEGALRARARARGVASLVRIRGWTDSPAELAEVYRRSGLVVCASTCEGGPRVTVEGMACGTPAVSTPVGMMMELLEDGRNGYLAGFDTETLAIAFHRVLGDEVERRRMGARARADVQGYEAERMLRDYARGIYDLVGVPFPE